MNWYRTALMPEEDKADWMKDIDDIIAQEDEDFDDKGKTIFYLKNIVKYPYGFAMITFTVGGKDWEYVVGNDVADKMQRDLKAIRYKNRDLSYEEVSRILYGRYIPQNKKSEVRIDGSGNKIDETYKEF